MKFFNRKEAPMPTAPSTPAPAPTWNGATSQCMRLVADASSRQGLVMSTNEILADRLNELIGQHGTGERRDRYTGRGELDCRWGPPANGKISAIDMIAGVARLFFNAKTERNEIDLAEMEALQSANPDAYQIAVRALMESGEIVEVKHKAAFGSFNTTFTYVHRDKRAAYEQWVREELLVDPAETAREKDAARFWAKVDAQEGAQ